MLKGYGAFFAFLVRFGAFLAMKYLGVSILPGAFGYTRYYMGHGSTAVLVLVPRTCQYWYQAMPAIAVLSTGTSTNE